MFRFETPRKKNFVRVIKPKFIITTGNRKKPNLGDLLIATSSYPNQKGKILNTVDPSLKFIH
jgi:hypothetical protein